MSSTDYHDRPELSRSMLMTFRESRREYHATYIAKTMPHQKETNALRLGTVSHCQILQPERFDELVRIIPDELLAKNGAKSTSACKTFIEEHETAGRVCMKADELTDVLGMANSVRNALPWITDGKAIAEQPIMWTDEATGLKLRCLPDFLLPLDRGILCVDVKTTSNLKKFPWQVRDDYWMQHVHYTAGITAEYGVPCRFLFAAVRSNAPYQCWLYEMSENMVAVAIAAWRETLEHVARCYETGDWSDYQEYGVNQVDYLTLT